MKKYLIVLIVCTGFSAAVHEPPFSLWNWKLELPSGYQASDWKLSNFQKDRFAAPFFYLDSIDGALVMEAYPTKGSSKSKYTRNTLREQMQAGSNDRNWTMKEGGTITVEFQVTKMSKDENGKYHRTLLLQVDGRTTIDQTEDLDLEKPVSMPFVKIYWQDERLRITRRLLKDESVVGNLLLTKEAWKESEGIYAENRIGFERVKLKMTLKKGKIIIEVNDEKPIVYRDLSVSQWYFENFFTVGNYLQSKDDNSHSVVKYHQIAVEH